MAWIPVTERKPPCPKGEDLGTPVLIWPRNPDPSRHGTDGFCFYGRRATSRPAFYIFGAPIEGVTHWMPLPEGPPNKKERSSRGKRATH